MPSPHEQNEMLCSLAGDISPHEFSMETAISGYF